MPPSPSSQVLDQERVRQQFNLALDAMNSSVEGAGPTLPTPLPGTYGSAAAAAAGGRWGGAAAGGVAQPPLPPEPQPPLPPPVSAADLTLRDLVQQFAEESGVTFVPRFGRTHDGLQVRMLMGGGLWDRWPLGQRGG